MAPDAGTRIVACSLGNAILVFDPARPDAVFVRDVDAALLARVRAASPDIGPIVRVRVVPEWPTATLELPDVAGVCEVRERDIVFTPHFPFASGVRYQATFAPDGCVGPALEFSVCAAPGAAPAVVGIFPSGAVLPANLLRLYVLFSGPMQRGFAADEVRVLTAAGRPAPDVLYRAPLELWDRGMRCLTVLLDPGRLKRGVGPHRALGPPLAEGLDYILSIGDGMRGADGVVLQGGANKRFRVGPAVREPVAVREWMLTPPHCGTRQALVLAFPRSLDWAMLHHAIRVSADGVAVHGSVEVGCGERSWRFTPHLPWASGEYQVEAACALEDCCGNDLKAAFDRPLRAMPTPGAYGNDAVLSFRLARG